MTRTNIIKLGCTLPMVALVAAACATKTGTGALIGAGGGAAAGAGLGALIGGKQGAAVGAGVGAAAGAGTGALIGRYMDKQEEDLKKVNGLKVEREGDQIVAKFNSAILFDTGKSVLKPSSQTDLSNFAKVLKDYKDTDLVIEGHTDNTGKKTTNQKLSLARADAVISFLESQGVERARMKGMGFADEQPVGDNTTDSGRQANRRVQVQIAANEKLKKEDAASTTKPAAAAQAQ